MKKKQKIPTIEAFTASLNFSLREFHTKKYFLSSNMRHYRSLVDVIKKIPEKARILSLGAGGAFVEEYLARNCEALITVADFPAVLELNQKLYNTIFEKTIPVDLVASPLDFGNNLFDAILWFDNIEHVPRDPKEIILSVTKSLKYGGFIFLATDNIACLRNIGKLLIGHNILPNPSRLFSPVSFENEGVHRRLYTAKEIKNVFSDCGLTCYTISYLWQKRRTGITIPFMWIETLFPRFRPHMLISAKKC